MRILYQNPRTGEMKLLPSSLEDLWHLYNIIEKGDVVSGYTFRREEARQDSIRADKEERVRVFAAIEVEKTEFSEYQNALRITGRIKEGISPIGSYHTMNVGAGNEITIKKERWPEHILQRIRDAVEGKKDAKLIAVAIEYGEATVALIKSYGVQEIASIRATASKGSEDEMENSFYDEIVRVVASLPPMPIIVVGPGFIKEDFLRRARELQPALFARAQLIQTGQGGMQGIREAMSRAENTSLVEGVRLAEEARLMEELKRELATGGKCTYGREQVREALSLGAVRTVLITDRLLRGGGMDELLSMAEEKRAEIAILTSAWDPGKELDALGGIAALLRYRIQ